MEKRYGKSTFVDPKAKTFADRMHRYQRQKAEQAAYEPIYRQFRQIRNNESAKSNRESFDRITQVMGKYNSKNSVLNSNKLSGLSNGSSFYFGASSIFGEQQDLRRDPGSLCSLIVKDCDNYYKSKDSVALLQQQQLRQHPYNEPKLDHSQFDSESEAPHCKPSEAHARAQQ